MSDQPLKILILGAHPDDCEYSAGPLVVQYCQRGHQVKMVSVTDGRSGHFRTSGPELVAIRRAEFAASAALVGATAEVWDHPDGALLPTLELRSEIIREIRTFAPDVVLTHRTNDYHPDHRAVGQAVQDASYMVTVPPVLPEVPHLRRDPVVAYLPDFFTKPTSLQGDVVLAVSGDDLRMATRMMACHRSQFFEWLPYNQGLLEQVPADDDERVLWLERILGERYAQFAARYRSELAATYGPAQAETIRHALAFEFSEYAGRVETDAEKRRLFPMLPR